MPYEIYGKISLQCGKTLWEILGNLKNHGVGRIVVRNQFKRYPEPSWYRILKVETVAPEVRVSLCSVLLLRCGSIRLDHDLYYYSLQHVQDYIDLSELISVLT